MDTNNLLFSLNHWGEFGMIRYQATLAAGEKRRIPLIVPAGRWWVIFKYRFGSFYEQGVLITDVINFRFDNVRNYFEQNILLGSELFNFVVEPHPPLVASGNNGAIIVWNTAAIPRNFSIVLDFYVVDNEIQGRIRELIFGEREEFRGEIVQQQYQTPSE